MKNRTISNKKYPDGKDRIILIRSNNEKVVINDAYDYSLSAQVKLNKNYKEGTKSKRYYKNK